MPTLEPLQTELFQHPTIRHGFFNRHGGVSESIYASLNCAYGSKDQVAHIRENRLRVALVLGVDVESLCSLRQAHTSEVLTVTRSFGENRPVADGLVTQSKGVALAVLGADCAPVLLADARAQVIGVAHAGWKGALDGILENTIKAMLALGARLCDINACIGPAIQQTSYEVGAEFRERFIVTSGTYARFFAPGCGTKFHFDLPLFIEHRLTTSGLTTIERFPLDTCTDEERFFSYRRATLRGEPDYGRQISAITLG